MCVTESDRPELAQWPVSLLFHVSLEIVQDGLPAGLLHFGGGSVSASKRSTTWVPAPAEVNVTSTVRPSSIL